MVLPIARMLLAIAALTTAAQLQDAYDYIIVGGGTAGAALAARLSIGLPEMTVLLLEAGPAALDDLRINVPGLRGSLLKSAFDWNFTSTAQNGLDGRKIDVNRGKVLGGSSAMNYLCYDRAATAEYDAWSELGSEGWTWDIMIRAMAKSENFTGNDGDIHGHHGPIRTTYNRIVPNALRTWKPTVSKLGVPINDGTSLGGSPVGVMYQPTNIDIAHWNRSYSANTYLLHPKENLTILTEAQAIKVSFSKKEELVATGVILQNGTTITARREVILSAGSIQSPGLLELSGIGQFEILEKAGIDKLLHLPGVGENYQDHIRTSNTYRLKPGYESFDPLIYDSNSSFATNQMDLWLQNETSWYDMTTSAYAFLNWSNLGNKTEREMLLLAEASISGNATSVDKKKLEYLRNPSIPQLELIMEANYVGASGYPGGNFVTIFTSVMHPMARGSVHINPAAPNDKPNIDLQYFVNEYDVRAVMEGAKYARKIAETEPMRSIWDLETDPGSNVQTEEQFRKFAINTVDSFYHPIGTCAMLPKRDGGVVNSELIVYGTENLRVVDASIIPIQMSGHPQTSVYGIAEVAAEKIIASAGQ